MTSFIAGTNIHVGDACKERYAPSVTSSPSSRSSSSDDVFSNGDARSSQSSAPSSVKGSPLTYDSEAPSESDSYNHQQNELEQSLSHTRISRPAVAAELRRHPRRTCVKADLPELKHDSANKRPVPTLIRQCDRKEQFVEALVGKPQLRPNVRRRSMLKQALEDTTTEMIEVIWPLSVAQCSLPHGAKNILGLRKFVQEVLRRSKTSYSTLQVALFYLVLLIPYVPRPEDKERREDPPACRALRCGRRMFLAALILASKYLQDRNYSMLAWAKISGLQKQELVFNELAFLRTVNYNLHIPEQLFKVWADIVLQYSLADECRRARALNGGRCEKWRAIVPCLTRDLSGAADFDADVSQRQEKAPWTQQWTPPASPPASVAPSRSESPLGGAVSAKPAPPRFLEPKAMTSVELGLRSPKLSKLETPCLPPINFDFTPAASGSRQCPLGRSSSMGMALKQAGVAINGRLSCDALGMGSRVKTTPCSRRSCLSGSGPAAPAESWESATWGRRTATAADITAQQPLRARESCLRASSTVESGCEEATSAARALQDISCANSAYPTPMSMDSMTDGSSVSELDEISTPKVLDVACRPVVRNALKRERPTSVCENEAECVVPDGRHVLGLPNILKHAGGIPVDYGSGVDEFVGRSRHVRNSSGSLAGARKRNRLVGGQS